jgi:hypothetical protein
MSTVSAPKGSEFWRLATSEQILEVFYKRSSELTKVAFYAIGAAYPMAERRKNPKIEYRYADAYQQAKYHRNFHKNIVEDSILPLAAIVKHPRPFAGDGPTDDFRKLVITQFAMLHKRLQDYAGMLVPVDQVEGYVSTLDKVYATELELLKNGPPPDGLAHYQAVPKFTSETF